MGIQEHPKSTKKVAVVFGVTGLVGKELVNKLLSESKWKVYGISRKPDIKPIRTSNYHCISCDLLNPSETERKLSFLHDVTHVFWVTWATQFPLDTYECSEQNKAMLSNALNSMLPKAKALKHVSLQTGMKHYVSIKGPSKVKEDRLYDENAPRATSGHNFYYVLEDLLKERLTGKAAWSVHRPGLITGCSQRTTLNFIGTLCVYGTICKHLNLPFVFGGTKDCWEEMYLDASDARLVAEQHIWAATNDAIHKNSDGQAFNAINGPSFTWKEIWPAIGSKLGAVVTANGMFSSDFMVSKAMADKGGVWKEIVMKEGLVVTEMEDLANWSFLDVLFRCPVKMLGTRYKADQLGFSTTYETLDSILYWIDAMRNEKLIP
ncbi:hypothetical protein RJ639_032869 [Escallonia herrerae]|uniref:PRISE-like Rossmann-fold domain-containing protein n=1 Tax=Escallonia herrerae TaxID=1293975 RepID=A0AA89B9T8_9ASTE|nr:hypothetical protein RJ639_032869 [Escallonia herrerae]